MLNLETHIPIYFLGGELTAREQDLMASDDWTISDIVLGELAKLTERGRVELDFDSEEFRLPHRSLKVIPIIPETARASARLGFSSDPADEIIAATSLVEKISLLTRDRRILKSGIVPFAR